jgi:hydrogenase expression/formation protein HypE
VCIKIEEGKILVRAPVRAACETLGYDPLYVANEGKLVAIVAPEDADMVLEAMRGTRYGEGAAIIRRSGGRAGGEGPDEDLHRWDAHR